MTPAETTTPDVVADDETLYRRVPQNTPPQPFYDRSGNQIRVLSSAFLVSSEAEGPFQGRYRVSVDRATLRQNNPRQTASAMTVRGLRQFAVVCIPVGEARAIREVEDIVADPLPDNAAHALICIVHDPSMTRNENRRVMREAAARLADLANSRPWAVLPDDPAVPSMT